MKEINLREYYPFYTQDVIVEVPDEVAIFSGNLSWLMQLLFCVHTGIKHTFLWITMSMWSATPWWLF